MWVHVTKSHIVSLICVIIGLLLIGSGASAYFHMQTALSFDELTPQACEAGDYVCGNIRSYVVSSYDTANEKGVYSTVSHSYVSLLGPEWDTYIIPIADGKYIRLLVSDSKALEALERFDHGRGGELYLVGQLERGDEGPSMDWIRNVREFEGKDINDILVMDYIIREIDYAGRFNHFKSGLIMLAAGFVFWVMFGGSHKIIEKGTVETEEETAMKVKKRLVVSHNKEFDLESENSRMRILYRRLQEQKKACLWRLPLLVAGIAIFYVSHYAAGMLLGVILIISFLRAFVRWFLDSGNRAALFLCKLLKRQSLWQQYMECNKRIQILQNLLDEEKEAELN